MLKFLNVNLKINNIVNKYRFATIAIVLITNIIAMTMMAVNAITIMKIIILLLQIIIESIFMAEIIKYEINIEHVIQPYNKDYYQIKY